MCDFPKTKTSRQDSVEKSESLGQDEKRDEEMSKGETNSFTKLAENEIQSGL
jgi:hypothetical protein